MRNRAIHFFHNVSMTLGHDGLAEVAAKAKVRLDYLRPGEFACFVNKSFTAMKLMTGCGVLVYWRQPSRRRLFAQAIGTLPKFLAGEEIGFSREVQAAMQRHYRKVLERESRARVAAKQEAA